MEYRLIDMVIVRTVNNNMQQQQVTAQELAQEIREHAGDNMPITILVSNGVSTLSAYYSGDEIIPYHIQHISMIDMDIDEIEQDGYTLEAYAQEKINVWAEMIDKKIEGNGYTLEDYAKEKINVWAEIMNDDEDED